MILTTFMMTLMKTILWMSLMAILTVISMTTVYNDDIQDDSEQKDNSIDIGWKEIAMFGALSEEIADEKKERLRIEREMNKDKDQLYLLWRSGLYSNQQIGELFGLSYSSVSRRAALTHKRYREDATLQKKVHQLNDLIKV